MAKKVKQESGESLQVTIAAPNYKTAVFCIRGVEPYVQERFSDKARRQIEEDQSRGSVRSPKKREPRKPEEDCEGATYRPVKGDWKYGAVPVTHIKMAMINTIRNIPGITMTAAKQMFWIVPDGFDKDGTPLIKMTKGNSRMFQQPVRNSNGRCDLRYRPMWDAGWEATVKVQFNADVLGVESITSILIHAGMECGIGAGRKASRQCAGCGWGSFEVITDK